MNKLLLTLLCIFLCSEITSSQTILNDNLVDETLSNIEIKKPESVIEYDYSATDNIIIPLRITKKITTALIKKSYEGQNLEFIVEKDVYYNQEKLVSKGDSVTARLEIITTRGLVGVPAEIFITDFDIPNLDNNKIMEPVSKRGFSTTALIIPVKAILTPFPPFGSISNIFIGFNASLTPKKTIKIHYYPKFQITTK